MSAGQPIAYFSMEIAPDAAIPTSGIGWASSPVSLLDTDQPGIALGTAPSPITSTGATSATASARRLCSASAAPG